MKGLLAALTLAAGAALAATSDWTWNPPTHYTDGGDIPATEELTYKVYTWQGGVTNVFEAGTNTLVTLPVPVGKSWLAVTASTRYGNESQFSTVTEINNKTPEPPSYVIQVSTTITINP